MMKRYAWSKDIDDEVWYGGPCDSIKECVREANIEPFTSCTLNEALELNKDKPKGGKIDV